MGAFTEFMGMARRSLETMREAYGLLQRARSKTDEARTRLLAATEGSGNAKVDASAARLKHVEEALTKAAEHAVGGAEAFKAYLRLIGVEDAIGESEQSAAQDRSPQKTPAQRTRLKGFNPKAIHPGAVRELATAGWPRNSDDNISARADLYEGNGTKLNNETLTPYPYRSGPERPELKPRFNNPGMATTWHVEGELAQIIRDSRAETFSVYLNIRRCGAARSGDERPAPLGCTENFQHIIPRDSVVYVHVIQENGRTMTQRVIGTGEGIK